MRHIFSGIEVAVAWRVEGEVHMRVATVIFPIGDPAQIPKGPSRQGWGTGDVARVGFEEVHDVQRVAITSTGEQSQEN